MTSRDPGLLEDMRLNARYALDFVDGLAFAEFAANREKYYAVVRCLEIVGEAANHVSDACKAALPELEWAGMIGLRHVVIHNYGRVDLPEIWAIVHRDLPRLIERLTAYLGQFE